MRERKHKNIILNYEKTNVTFETSELQKFNI
jgi:hypothetical protein